MEWYCVSQERISVEKWAKITAAMCGDLVQTSSKCLTSVTVNNRFPCQNTKSYLFYCIKIILSNKIYIKYSKFLQGGFLSCWCYKNDWQFSLFKLVKRWKSYLHVHKICQEKVIIFCKRHSFDQNVNSNFAPYDVHSLCSADGDPHFLLELPERRDALCFNINDKPGTILNLVRDPQSGQHRQTSQSWTDAAWRTGTVNWSVLFFYSQVLL